MNWKGDGLKLLVVVSIVWIGFYCLDTFIPKPILHLFIFGMAVLWVWAERRIDCYVNKLLKE